MLNLKQRTVLLFTALNRPFRYYMVGAGLCFESHQFLCIDVAQE